MWRKRNICLSQATLFPLPSSFPCIFSVKSSSHLQLTFACPPLRRGGNRSSPRALYHFLRKQPHLKSYLTSANSSKESLLPKEAQSHATQVPSSFPWPLTPGKSVLFDLCCEGGSYTFIHPSGSITFHSDWLVGWGRGSRMGCWGKHKTARRIVECSLEMACI